MIQRSRPSKSRPRSAHHRRLRRSRSPARIRPTARRASAFRNRAGEVLAGDGPDDHHELELHPEERRPERRPGHRHLRHLRDGDADAEPRARQHDHVHGAARVDDQGDGRHALPSAYSWSFTTAPRLLRPLRASTRAGLPTRTRAGKRSWQIVLHRRLDYTSSHAITGTSDQALYQNERWGNFSYAIPVNNGTYDVKLHFVELYYGTSVPGGNGKRVFGIDVLDTPTNPDLQNIDIYSEVGANTALVKTITGVTVTDGVLNIQSVYGAADDPEIAAIEVVPSTGPPPRRRRRHPA